MLKKTGREVLIRWLIFTIGFTVGVGVSHWDKVEYINIFVYAALAGLTLIGFSLGGYELWRGARSYRKALGQTLENSSKVFATRVPLPPLPKPEILELGTEFIRSVEASTPAENES